MAVDYLSIPVDAESAASVAASGLRMELIDTTDRERFTAWLRADVRGFHSPALDDGAVDAMIAGTAYRRTTAVWDDAAADPVGTVNSWATELTVPGPALMQCWAISSVTVASTHRRRGIARALLEAELRTARALGLSMAMLTVSEATIYGRYGFASAASGCDWVIDTRRVAWRSPPEPGRILFTDAQEFRGGAPGVWDRARVGVPGAIEIWGRRWDQIAGLVVEERERAKTLRFVRYDDRLGVAQGYAVYRVSGGEPDFTAHTLTIEDLVVATDEAYRALWGFLLSVDLVTEVRASLRSVDEPARWLLGDLRALTSTERDHLWLRILDVPDALRARRYSAELSVVLRIRDALGFAEGTYRLEVGPDGTATVSTDAAPPDLELDVAELSSLFLGGVRLSTLVRAGRVIQSTEGAASRVDAAFASPSAPSLGYWF